MSLVSKGTTPKGTETMNATDTAIVFAAAALTMAVRLAIGSDRATLRAHITSLGGTIIDGGDINTVIVDGPSACAVDIAERLGLDVHEYPDPNLRIAAASPGHHGLWLVNLSRRHLAIAA